MFGGLVAILDYTSQHVRLILFEEVCRNGYCGVLKFEMWVRIPSSSPLNIIFQNGAI